MSNSTIKEIKCNKLSNDLNISKIPFEILPFSSYVDVKAMNIISSDVEGNEYKLLSVKSNKLVNALKQFNIHLFFINNQKFKQSPRKFLIW